MLAGFIGLRLVSVLGKRTGSEKAIDAPVRSAAGSVAALSPTRAEAAPRRPVAVPAGTGADLAPALQTVADADASFDPDKFLTGAQGAYRLILEAFWAGDAGAMHGLVSDEILDHFRASIAARDGVALPNSLARIDTTAITAARMVGQMAEVTVRFDAAIAAAGGAAAPTHDVWTFSRHIGGVDPAWLLIATDGHE